MATMATVKGDYLVVGHKFINWGTDAGLKVLSAKKALPK